MLPYVFVTGMPRSGTTLVDKVLSLHPRAQVLSQPLPLLYVRVKRLFGEATGLFRTAEWSKRYPLSDMFGDGYYPPRDFVDFLERLVLGPELCRQALEEMISFSGQYTKPAEPLRVLEGYRPGGLWSFVARYAEELTSSERLSLIGSKESYCEEYVPYFLARGARVVLIVRDPRDVITSLDHGRGRDFVSSRPLLFTIRQWRKSVAFALAHASVPELLVLRYEELVRHPRSLIDRVFRFLELPEYADEVLAGELRSQSGEVWHSNSSHFSASRITDASVGRYREHLSGETDAFIQACCRPEMRALGYELDVAEEDVTGILRRWVTTDGAADSELSSFVWSDARREEEEARLEKLRSGVFDPRLFIFEASFSRLQGCSRE